jgi:hypothetical protein
MRGRAVHSEIPHFMPQTNPTSLDEFDTTGQVFFDARMIPTPPDQYDHTHPSFNPKVRGSRPGRPTNGCVGSVLTAQKHSKHSLHRFDDQFAL